MAWTTGAWCTGAWWPPKPKHKINSMKGGFIIGEPPNCGVALAKEAALRTKILRA